MTHDDVCRDDVSPPAAGARRPVRFLSVSAERPDQRASRQARRNRDEADAMGASHAAGVCR